MHSLIDLRGNTPTFIHVSDGKMHDVHSLDMLVPRAGAIHVMDRGYVDFGRWYRLHQADRTAEVSADQTSRWTVIT